jgi:hypothetical protein
MAYTNVSSFKRVVLFTLIVSISTLTGLQAQAKLYTTGEVLQQTTLTQERAQVQAFLENAAVEKQLGQLGVNPTEARSRVAALSDSEVHKIAGRLNQLPAGGDGLGLLVGTAVFVFIILLITDIVGLTHVFPFVNHPRKI